MKMPREKKIIGGDRKRRGVWVNRKIIGINDKERLGEKNRDREGQRGGGNQAGRPQNVPGNKESGKRRSGVLFDKGSDCL